MEASISKLNKLLESRLQETDIFLVDMVWLPGNKLRVFIDSDSGLTIDHCAEISRFLKFHIDHEQLLPDTYEMEVSSPGLEQPLKFFRQYRKNVGRKVEVSLLDNSYRTGLLLFVDQDKITIEEKIKNQKGPAPKGKEPKSIKMHVTIPFEEIKSTKVKLNF